MTTEVILQDIFVQVLEIHRLDFDVTDDEIKHAISEMHFVYSKRGQQKGATRTPINYNKAAHRCAYLFKYAAVHTALVQHTLLKFYHQTDMLDSLQLQNQIIKTCCLGGGPGTDVIGVASVLFSLCFRFRRPGFHFTIVDCMSAWKTTFETVVQEAGQYRSLDRFLSDQVKCFYICDNLLNPGQQTSKTVESADIITMIKFLSAANPKGIPAMLKKIFTWMKPGAVILFIDNACGGFYEKVAQAASDCGLRTERKPYRHMEYEKDVFENYDFGHFSLCSVTVAAQMWKKPFPKPSPAELQTALTSSKALCSNNTWGTASSTNYSLRPANSLSTARTSGTSCNAQSSNSTWGTAPSADYSLREANSLSTGCKSGTSSKALCSNSTRGTAPPTNYSLRPANSLSTARTSGTSCNAQSSNSTWGTALSTDYSLRAANSLLTGCKSGTTGYRPHLVEQIIREMVWSLEKQLPLPYSTHLRPSSEAQFADRRSSVRTAETSAIDHLYENSDEQRSFNKTDHTTECHVNETKRNNSWCTIL